MVLPLTSQRFSASDHPNLFVRTQRFMDLKPLFVFPRWSNTATLLILLFLASTPVYAIALIGYALDPVTLNVGYQPVQPVPYSHKLHVGDLGIDCRYCHNTVEKADFAAIPPTETCINCHKTILPGPDKNGNDPLKPVRESYMTGLPVPWHQVTTVPDYVYFNHSAHVNSGISCVECHGQINQMETVYQAKPMNMAWCIQCHRDPTDRIRPRDMVTKLFWKPSASDPSTVASFASLPDAELMARAGKVGISSPSAAMTVPVKENLARQYVQKITDTKSVEEVKEELGAKSSRINTTSTRIRTALHAIDERHRRCSLAPPPRAREERPSGSMNEAGQQKPRFREFVEREFPRLSFGVLGRWRGAAHLFESDGGLAGFGGIGQLPALAG